MLLGRGLCWPELHQLSWITSQGHSRSAENTDSIFGAPSYSCPCSDLPWGFLQGSVEVNVCPDWNVGRFVLVFSEVVHRRCHLR